MSNTKEDAQMELVTMLENASQEEQAIAKIAMRSYLNGLRDGMAKQTA